MTYRIAKSLGRMREQINKHSPTRNKASDGWIGDARHAASTSDHNPWVKDGGMGIVTALDITHDPRNKVDTYIMAEHLRQGKDPRIKYVISNRRIFSSTVSPWQWRTYTGSNPHSSHIHISVNTGKHHYDDERDWHLFPRTTVPSSDDPILRPVLRRGSKGEDVRILQRIVGGLVIDGDFGPRTEEAVKKFQQANGLKADGIVGPATWGALDKIEQVPQASGDPIPLEDDIGEGNGTSTTSP
jgi:hypothetical protein